MKNVKVLLALFSLCLLPLYGGVSNPYFNGFEVDTTGWNLFGGSYDAVRVPSGTDGVTSKSGAFHGEALGSGIQGTEASSAVTNWGGYSDNLGCASTACAAGAFPADGYLTYVDVYLDLSASTANDTRFDFTSAINRPDGVHRRDFAFNAGFYNDSDATGSGPRFVISASNNTNRSGAYPKNPGRDPIAITQTGWYTFRHMFYDNGSGVLAVDLSVIDSTGAVIHTWTLSDATDIIGGTVGGNRYGWFPNNEFAFLAIDNSKRTGVAKTISCFGFKAPLANGPVTMKKGNRALPFKADLVDGDGLPLAEADLAAAPVIQIEFTPEGGGTPVDVTGDALPAGQGTDGNQFVFDGAQWHFNLLTKNYSAKGTYTVTIVSGDSGEYLISPQCTATFVIQ